MKKMIMIMGAVFAISLTAAHAQNYTVTVGTNSTVCIPDAKVSDGTVWTNGLTVAQGDYVVVTGAVDYVYFALSAGTAANAPSHTVGTATGADTIKWLYHCRRYQAVKRANAILFADDSTTTYYSRGTATTEGGLLDALRPARSFPGEDGDVSCIVASGTATIAVELKKGNH